MFTVACLDDPRPLFHMMSMPGEAQPRRPGHPGQGPFHPST